MSFIIYSLCLNLIYTLYVLLSMYKDKSLDYNMTTSISQQFDAPYDPNEHEASVLDMWRNYNYENPDTCIQNGFTTPDAPCFSIVLPPPNVTGVLHLGHALTITIEDIMVRYKRMKGYRTLWIPGTDHAAIATQTKAEKQLEKEGIKKQDLSRAEFFEKIQEYAITNQNTIKQQITRMGASLDWSREAFTLDDRREKAVRTAFKKMYEDGLIFQKERVINWDPKGRTTVSDDEVEHQTGTATLYTFRYSTDFPIPIATTRPETKVGDTAVAVHPDDDRYNNYIGETYNVPFAGENLSLTIIGDSSIDMDFGTGAVGVTPAHSMADWELAQKHDLPLKQVIDERARMTAGVEGVIGEKTQVARERIVDWLRDHNLIENEKEVEQNISTAQRSGGVIEPIPKMQWFIDVNKEFVIPRSNISGISSGQRTTLKTLMRSAVENGDITFIPNRYIKNYYNWIDKLRDWCISRQIIYGHRIPVWYRKDNNGTILETHVDVEEPSAPSSDEIWEQDPDTLDTWFSSGLWTFSTLGWPDDTDDLATYHPTNMLETGHDILFFWIARMILMSTYLLGEVPFTHTYLHGTIRDANGITMSKSRGNGIDPLEVIQEYGTDALRMALIVGNTPGTDLSVSYERFKAHKKFTNKLWNVARFIYTNACSDTHAQNATYIPQHQVYYDEFTTFKNQLTKEMDAHQFHVASDKLYNYIWHTFADTILEDMKKSIVNGTDGERHSANRLLYQIFIECIHLLHPFTPFITETLWSFLRPEDKSDPLMIQKWPDKNS